MEFVNTHRAKDGFTADIYKSVSGVTNDVVYSAYPQNAKPSSGARLFGGAFFKSVDDIVKMLG